MTELNDTFYLSAVLVTQKLDRKLRDSQEPEPRIRPSKKVDRPRREKRSDFDNTCRNAVENEHDIKKKRYNLVIEELKRSLRTTAGKIRRYNERFYQDIQGKDKQSETLNREVLKISEKVFEKKAEMHNQRAQWFDSVRKYLNRNQTQNDVRIDMERLQTTLKKYQTRKCQVFMEFRTSG